MPSIFCMACGHPNDYMGSRPKKCEACDASLEPKPVAKARAIQRAEPEYEPESKPDYDVEAVKASISTVAEEGDGGPLTVEKLRKSGVAVARGGAPVEADIRDGVLNTLLNKGHKAEPVQMPETGGSKARRVQRLTR